MHTFFLGIGSNINAETNIVTAADKISRVSKITAFSSHVITPPLKNRPQANYINAVWKIETARSFDELKNTCRDIEYALGRRRTADTYAAREIDIDILVFDDIIADDSLHERDFVYGPLLEIEPDFRIPELSGSVEIIKKYKGKYRLSDITEVLEKKYLKI